MTSIPPSRPSTTESRIAELEQALAALTAEVATLRAELRGGSSVRRPARAAVVPGRQRAAERRNGDRRAPDLERLLGRYGMLIIAGLAAAGAVGTFLSWAIGRGYLTFTPAARVVVGFALAFALGAWGLRLRRRERSFGSSMLGLALAIALLCSYAAGPGFHLVPTLVAFTGAAVLSWALALFALNENDEPLWCIGLAGAAVAPFATSNGDGNVFALLAYGLVVTLPASLAIAQRRWPVGWRLFYATTALYSIAGAALGSERGVAGVIAALSFPFVISLGAVIPFAPDERKRGALRWLIALGALTALIDRAVIIGEPGAIPAAFAAAAVLALALVDAIADVPQTSVFAATRSSLTLLDWLDAAVIPSVFLYLYISSALSPARREIDYALGVAAFSVFSWRRSASTLRDAAAVAAAAALVALVDAFALAPLPEVASYLVASLVALAVHRARPSRGWLASGAALVAIAGAQALDALVNRAMFQYTPFVTLASACAAAVTLTLIVVARFRESIVAATRASIPPSSSRGDASSLPALAGRVASAAPWVWAFVWALVELAKAYSPSTSTLLLVTYFAATGVACVAMGRARELARLRHIGLGLALVAALTAIYGASQYFDFGARILAYLVTSVFLLGIAYWYRKPGTEPEVTEAANGLDVVK